MGNSEEIRHLMKKEFAEELIAIADWWTENLVESSQSSLVGLVDENAKKHCDSRRSLVYTSRVLWFFSELAKHNTNESKNQKYTAIATMAYQSIIDEFYDQTNGGLFWEVSGDGHPLDRSKKVYGHAFCIYGLASYYEVTRSQEVADFSKELFETLNARFLEPQFGGFMETLGDNWRVIKDLRLSDDDQNYPKSMNAHLHVMESFTHYHRLWPTEASESALRNIIQIFRTYIVRDKVRLLLFANLDWSDQSEGVRSFGHEIEFSWLVCEAAEVLGCPDTTKWARAVAVAIADCILDVGMTAQGRIIESDSSSSVWWMQTEAIVGYINAYQIAGNAKFLEAAALAWSLVKKEHLSEHKGLWTWHDHNGAKKYFAGPWKGPYHDGRAMLEAKNRLEKIGPWLIDSSPAGTPVMTNSSPD